MSNESERLEELSQRLRALERQSLRWRVILIVILLVIAAIPVTWFAMEAQTLESKSFVLVDSAGKERATLSVSTDGSPSLVFYDANGKIVAMLHTKPGGSPQLGLYSATGDTLFKAP
jgi:lipopolysaccharide export system protein LptC